MFVQSTNASRPVATLALALAAPALLAFAAPASAATRPVSSAVHGAVQSQGDAMQRYRFTTLNDANDPTFNQLLGINDSGEIVGYFGSGLAGHPFRGYQIHAPYHQNDYKNENYPGAVATQVVAINNRRDTAGFWVDANGNNFGFIEWNGVFTSYTDPNTGTGTVNQILGLNDHGIAVGFYTDGAGLNHGFALNQATGKFFELTPPGGNNVTAAGINDNGDVTGFLTATNGAVIGFLYKNGAYSEFSFPNATSTTPFGISSTDEIVGSYLGSMGATHGFTLTNPLSHAMFHPVDDPNGIGTTVVNGVNTAGDLVGFYLDKAGFEDGFLAKR